MLGLEFEKEVGALRKELIFNHRIFTGGSSNKKPDSNITTPQCTKEAFGPTHKGFTNMSPMKNFITLNDLASPIKTIQLAKVVKKTL